jgi:hypothetical protein
LTFAGAAGDKRALDEFAETSFDSNASPFSAFGRASLDHVAQLPAGSILPVRSIDQLDIALLKEL